MERCCDALQGLFVPAINSVMDDETRKRYGFYTRSTRNRAIKSISYGVNLAFSQHPKYNLAYTFPPPKIAAAADNNNNHNNISLTGLTVVCKRMGNLTPHRDLEKSKDEEKTDPNTNLDSNLDTKLDTEMDTRPKIDPIPKFDSTDQFRSEHKLLIRFQFAVHTHESDLSNMRVAPAPEDLTIYLVMYPKFRFPVLMDASASQINLTDKLMKDRLNCIKKVVRTSTLTDNETVFSLYESMDTNPNIDTDSRLRNLYPTLVDYLRRETTTALQKQPQLPTKYIHSLYAHNIQPKYFGQSTHTMHHFGIQAHNSKPASILVSPVKFPRTLSNSAMSDQNKINIDINNPLIRSPNNNTSRSQGSNRILADDSINTETPRIPHASCCSDATAEVSKNIQKVQKKEYPKLSTNSSRTFASVPIKQHSKTTCPIAKIPMNTHSISLCTPLEQTPIEPFSSQTNKDYVTPYSTIRHSPQEAWTNSSSLSPNFKSTLASDPQFQDSEIEYGSLAAPILNAPPDMQLDQETIRHSPQEAWAKSRNFKSTLASDRQFQDSEIEYGSLAAPILNTPPGIQLDRKNCIQLDSAGRNATIR